MRIINIIMYKKKHNTCIIISYRKLNKDNCFHRSASLKFNPNCGFTQYNKPNTYRSTFILVCGEFQSTTLHYCEIQVCTL